MSDGDSPDTESVRPEDEPIGLEYHGIGGVTEAGVRAIGRLLAMRVDISRALLLTSRRDDVVSGHGFILWERLGDPFAIKAGFTSGYGGTGPKGLSKILALMLWHGIDVEEIEVDAGLIERLNDSALSCGDMDWLEATRPLRPRRISEYIYDRDFHGFETINPWKDFQLTLPLAIIDDRLGDLIQPFWGDPDGILLKAHRRLEDVVRRRLGMESEFRDLSGVKLFSRAFQGNDAKLTWAGIGLNERQGRAQLFTSVAMAYRNARAHREDKSDLAQCVSEFLLLNHLFSLERAAVDGASCSAEVGN